MATFTSNCEWKSW